MLYKLLWLSSLTRSKTINFPDRSFQTKLKFHRKLSENLSGTDSTVNSALTMHEEISRRQTLSNLSILENSRGRISSKNRSARADSTFLPSSSSSTRISKLSSTNQEKRGTIPSDRYRIDESCLKAGIREFPSKRFLEGWLLNSRSKRNFVTNGFYDIFNVVVEQCETGLGRPGCRPVTPAESRPAHTETALTFTR